MIIEANKEISNKIHWHVCYKSNCHKMLGCLCNLGRDYPENVCNDCIFNDEIGVTL